MAVSSQLYRQIVPANSTDPLQPLDISVNKAAIERLHR